MRLSKILGAMAFLSLVPNIQAENKRPNIILFLVDDMGWQDTSVPFHTQPTPLNFRYNTPNMENLAAMGVKFTQAYASSVSSPSRCSLLTGANAARHKITNWTFKKDVSTDEKHEKLQMPQWNVNGVQPVQDVSDSFHATPLPRILSDNGYNTIICGKAHFGATDTPAANPINLGFKVNIAGHAAGGLASYLGTERFGHNENGEPVSGFAVPGLEKYWDEDIFVTEALTLEAINELEKSIKSKEPFFLYMSHYAVHVPLQADKRFVDKYLRRGLSQCEANYASMVEGVDKSLGDLMNYLKSKNELENTIIIFMSDNGGYSLDGRTPPLHTQNLPLRSGKGSAYEGGIRVPMIVYWNGVVNPGTTINDYVLIEDFFPSILEMAGVGELCTVQRIDGVSFVPIMKGETTAESSRSLIWNMPNNWISGDNREYGIGPACAIRQGDYKLIYWYEDGRKELYNIHTDIGETHNLAETFPQLTKRLCKLLSEKLRSVGAQRPFFITTGEPCPWPDGRE